MRHFEKSEEAIAEFFKHFPSHKPQFIVSSPGRVNIIGEHVDHQGYPVFPCAINQRCTMLCHVSPLQGDSNFIEIRHVEPAFTSKSWKTPQDVKVTSDKHWTNYIAAAWFGIVEFVLAGRQASDVGKNISPLDGLTSSQYGECKATSESLVNYSARILVSGDIPRAAGVSSSSSLVVTAALVFRECGKIDMNTTTLADTCANSERYVGTAGGGMDQAAILLSKRGFAQKISFNPLICEDASLPQEGVFVIANTGREINKNVSAAKYYNKRVFELKTAAFLFLSRVDPDHAETITGQQLLDLQWKTVVDRHLGGAPAEALDIIAQHVEQRPYGREEIRKILGPQRLKALLDKRCGQAVWEQNDEFLLYGRVKHVLTEAARVESFVGTCKRQDMTTDDKLRKLGELMVEAGKSLRDDFEASCQEVDELTAMALKFGAYGSRLTGAGWGGCTVSLIRSAQVSEFLENLRRNYYDMKIAAIDIEDPERLRLDYTSGPNYEDYLFVTYPDSGATTEFFS